MANREISFLFYDFPASRDVAHMNRLQRGAYFDFIQAQTKFGRLSMELVRRVLGKDFNACWTDLELILCLEDGQYYIHWLDESIAKRAIYTRNRIDNLKTKGVPLVPVGLPEEDKQPIVQQMAEQWAKVSPKYPWNTDDDYPALREFATFISEQRQIKFDPVNERCLTIVRECWSVMVEIIREHLSWKQKSLRTLARFNKQEIYSQIDEYGRDEKRMVL